MIVIIDYGMGNLGSVQNMLRKIGADVLITNDHNKITMAEKLILPGVGSFDNGMRNLIESGLRDLLEEIVLQKKKPLLGICLGMQLLTKSSEEGMLSGLGWIDAVTKRFLFEDSQIKIPHMGWNTVDIVNDQGLFSNIYPEPRFYFVHSYCISCFNSSDILTTTFYGYNFVSSFQSGNIMGVQFHPEKSHKFGMKLLKNFVELI
jgi:glutamine amidotransferase